MVFSLRNGNVLKVAIAVNGIRDTEREVEMYRKAPKKLRKYLAKVKGHGDGWVVMRKLTKKVRKRKGIRKRVKRLEKRFIKRKIHPGDLFSDNRKIRWANIRSGPKRRIVVIDYGNFKFK